uniref:EPS8 signaling adaptor L3a n=1 Tax=Tetraodon nigroviridis TaxID=99883 RepID=H3DAX3_TETNG
WSALYCDACCDSGYPAMDESASQSSNVSRPNARSIYLQRKEYAASVRQIMDITQYRVEHLFTFELDGRQLRNVSDCVEQLQLLEEMGRVWGQSMLLQVQPPRLLLTDIETKMELESVAIGDVLEVKAVLDSGPFNSLLTVSVQTRRRGSTSIFVFQSDIRVSAADLIQRDLSRALLNKPKTSSGPVAPPPQWAAPGWGESVRLHSDFSEDEDVPEPKVFAPEEEEPLQPSSKPYTQLEGRVDILNHILNDIEIVMGQVGAALAKKAAKKKKKKGARKKKVPKKSNYSMPTATEFASCLQKIKYGFNLLAELNGQISNPTAPEYVHFFFSTLAFVAPHSPVGLPMTIVVPLLTPACVQLLSLEVTQEEDRLWQSLGDAWNVPSNEWPHGDVQTYVPEFTDGWQPPQLAAAAKDPPSRVEARQPASSRVSPGGHSDLGTGGKAKWKPPPPPQEPSWSLNASHVLACPPSPPEPQYMRVMHDFTSRNSKELTIRKGDIVELLDMSRQWWKVRDARGEVGYVPNNVLEPYEEQLEQVGPNVNRRSYITHWETGRFREGGGQVSQNASSAGIPVIHSDLVQYSQQTGGPVVLTRSSRPVEVKTWLEYKAFSRITVRCLGGLSGATLLGMTKEELKTLCPEEGGRVFFQLQV